MIDLPSGITRNDGSIKDVPVGVLITEPGVARTCVRCGHEECPCCNDRCDSCLHDNPDDHHNARLDGDWVVSIYNIDGQTTETRHHIECARELRCKYDREPHPLMLAIHKAHGHVFANVGGEFGVTDDGRVWFHGETQDEYDARCARELAEQASMIEAVQTQRREKMAALEKMFRSMTSEQRAAYLEGMKHAQLLIEWSAEDFKIAGKKISESAAQKALANVAGGVTAFEAVHAEEGDKSERDE